MINTENIKFDIKFSKINKEDIKKLTEMALATATAPTDDMWENGIIPSGQFFSISNNEETIGYFVLDEENTIMEFYTVDSIDSSNTEKVFQTILKEKEVKKAYASTYYPKFYNTALKFKKDISDNTFLYELDENKELSCPFEDVTRELAKIEDLDEIIKYFEDTLGPGGEWLVGYTTNLINNDGLYLFKKDSSIIGSGEIRVNRIKDFANTGVVVATKFTSKGLGGYIVSEINKVCSDRNLKPVCSTTIDNISSQKALTKAGFICKDKIYNIEF